MISASHSQVDESILAPVVFGVVILFIMLFVSNSKSKHPLIPVELWGHSRFIRLVMAGAIYQFCSYGALLVLTLWASLSRNVDILQAGMIVMPCSLAWLAGNVSVWLSKNEWRKRIIRLGISIGAIGSICVVVSQSNTNFLMILGMVFAGYSSGLLASSLSAQAMIFAPPGSSGAASGMFNTSRQLGMVIAIATIAGFPVEPSISPQFLLILLGYVTIFFLTRGSLRKEINM